MESRPKFKQLLSPQELTARRLMSAYGELCFDVRLEIVHPKAVAKLRADLIALYRNICEGDVVLYNLSESPQEYMYAQELDKPLTRD